MAHHDSVVKSRASRAVQCCNIRILVQKVAQHRHGSVPRQVEVQNREILGEAQLLSETTVEEMNALVYTLKLEEAAEPTDATCH